MNAISKYFGAVDFMDNFVHGDNGNVQGIPNRSLQTGSGDQNIVENAEGKKQTWHCSGMMLDFEIPQYFTYAIYLWS